MTRKQLKHLIIAVVALALCIGAYFALRAWNGKQKEKEAAKDIYLFQSDALTSVSFTDADGQELAFTKTGDTWAYSDARFPLDATKLDSLVSALSSLKAVRRIDEPEALASYGLETPSNVVKAADTDQSLTLSIGGAAESNYYVRKNDEKAVYIISSSLVNALGVKLLDLAQIPSFPLLSEATIEKITLSGTAEPLTLTKATSTAEVSEKCAEDEKCEDGTKTKTETSYSWTDADGSAVAADDARLSGLLTTLNGLRFSACADYDADAAEKNAYGLDDPALLTVDYGEGSLKLAIGAEAEGQSEPAVYATLDDGSAVYYLAKTTADTILNTNGK